MGRRLRLRMRPASAPPRRRDRPASVSRSSAPGAAIRSGAFAVLPRSTPVLDAPETLLRIRPAVWIGRRVVMAHLLEMYKRSILSNLSRSCDICQCLVANKSQDSHKNRGLSNPDEQGCHSPPAEVGPAPLVLGRARPAGARGQETPAAQRLPCVRRSRPCSPAAVCRLIARWLESVEQQGVGPLVIPVRDQPCDLAGSQVEEGVLIECFHIGHRAFAREPGVRSIACASANSARPIAAAERDSVVQRAMSF